MRKLKVFVSWVLISLFMQVGFLYFLERQIKGEPLGAETSKAPVIIDTSVTLPTTQANNLQLAYAKDYLAYSDNQGLKVMNVKTSKVVFSENKPAKGDILGYHWLPDRNTLLCVIAKPNPVPKTTTTVSPQSQPVQKEDPNTGKPVNTPQTAPAAQYYNPQVTELYAIDFADPDQEVQPDKRLARKIDDFPADGKIESMDVSTYTNLIYMQVKTLAAQVVYEIDVMKNVRKVQRAGEKVANISVSDKKGTLYMQSNLAGINQIIAVKHSSREQLLRGSQYVLLGVQDDKVLVGQVENNVLSKILSLADTGAQEKISTAIRVEWQGNLPWKNYQAVTGSGNVLALYNREQAVSIQGGNVREVQFTGQANYVTSDGRERIEVVPTGEGTLKVSIKPW